MGRSARPLAISQMDIWEMPVRAALLPWTSVNLSRVEKVRSSFSQVLPAAVFTWWKTRCLLKMHKTKPGSGEQWLQMGNVFD